ncbi:Sec-independent protein translocase protein TatB [Methylotenera sp. G11]|uniref:Sec-independent protein translocase protein TatB n=1 Tax=Methylotenera sp. G11 TaxID=1506585 RepID=UPI000AC98B68|nr:Sec-independent protein translocase protein TatB [Methylotenera sp. G11]
MFDIAFSELVVIGIVALLVIGPDKLPKIARTAGHLFGRAQRYVNDVKSDINRELRFEELQSLQDEIRQNTQQPASPQYKAGQIIRHDMEQTAPKYQVGQIIRHDLEQNDHAAEEHQRPTMMADYIDPAPLKQGAAN